MRTLLTSKQTQKQLSWKRIHNYFPQKNANTSINIVMFHLSFRKQMSNTSRRSTGRDLGTRLIRWPWSIDRSFIKLCHSSRGFSIHIPSKYSYNKKIEDVIRSSESNKNNLLVQYGSKGSENEARTQAVRTRTATRNFMLVSGRQTGSTGSKYESTFCVLYI